MQLLDAVVPILVQVMVANIRCEEIAADQLEALLGDQTWEVLQTEAAAGLVSDFGSRASALLHSCLAGASPRTSLVSRHTLRACTAGRGRETPRPLQVRQMVGT